MSLKRRDFIKLSAGSTAGAALIGCATPAAEGKADSPLAHLTSVTGDVKPISKEERQGRIAKAQRLMKENKIQAIFLDAGTSMNYFTGVRWGQSERMMAAIIPADGEVVYVSPGFEEARVRELITLGDEVRVWQEHESPYEVVGGVFRDLGIRTGTIGMEERVRFFLFDGVRKVAPNLNYASADPVTIGCRMFKSPAEITLMQKANEVTLAAYKACYPLLEAGMTPRDFASLVSDAHRRLGASGGAFTLFGEASAYPHGTTQPQILKEGDIVLFDGGCSIEGYASDITRTVVFGEPSARQKEIWNLEKASQSAGFEAARLGEPCENVDIAARKVLTDAGFGPGYKVPGCPHRTGHGIGMDGHEWGNMVLGNKQPLTPGMCFSIEPTIAIYGEFGIRLEDCAYMTEEGVKWFTEQSPSLEQPFA